MRIVQIGVDAQGAVALHGFETVFDHVVKRLLHLIAIQLKQRQVRAQFLLHHDAAVLNLRGKEAHRFLDNRVHILRAKLRPRWPDGSQELRDDRIQAVDLRTGDIDRLLQLCLCAIAQLLHAALH